MHGVRSSTAGTNVLRPVYCTCNTNNPSCSRTPGCQVSGLRTNIKHRITSLDININTSTRTVTCYLSFAPDTTNLSGTAEKQHVRKSKCQPCLPYQVQSSTCICPYCIRAGEPHQQPCRVGDQQYEYVLL